MTLSYAIETRDGGRGEDRAACFRGVGCYVFVVADGAGGVGGGRVAAERVAAAAEELARGVYGSAAEALAQVDAELSILGCMSTGVIVELREGLLRGASCGDSIAWLIASGGVVELTEHQRRKPLLGAGGSPVSFPNTPFRGTLLLASDGLVNYASREAILVKAIGGSIAASAIEVAELPRMRSGKFPDDVAVVLSRSNVQVNALADKM